MRLRVSIFDILFLRKKMNLLTELMKFVLHCVFRIHLQNLAVSNSNLKWVKLHFPTYEHGWKKIFFWSSPFPESFWGSSLVSSWNLWNWNHSLLHTWPTPENFLCVFSNSWFCLWSLLHSSLVSTMSQCLKITLNVALEFFNFGIINELLSIQNVNVARLARNVEWDFFLWLWTTMNVWKRHKKSPFSMLSNETFQIKEDQSTLKPIVVR